MSETPLGVSPATAVESIVLSRVPTDRMVSHETQSVQPWQGIPCVTLFNWTPVALAVEAVGCEDTAAWSACPLVGILGQAKIRAGSSHRPALTLVNPGDSSPVASYGDTTRSGVCTRVRVYVLVRRNVLLGMSLA